jgi:hypothetical protein
METKNVKIITTSPESHADIIREAMGKAGAGAIGKYTFCSISSKIIGRFKPEQGANPFIGKIGKIEEVVEEKIEAICDRKKLKDVINAIKVVHPYEEPVLEIYPLEDFQ